MKNIILLTHGDFCKGIVHSCQLILGSIQEFKTLSITLDDNMDVITNHLKDIIESFNNDNPIIIVTDIPGGSTTQIAIKMIELYEVYVITGLNLNLLMSLAFLQLSDNKLDNMMIIKSAIEESKKGIYLVNDVMNNEGSLSDDDEL